MNRKQQIRKIMEINTNPLVCDMTWDFPTFRAVIKELHELCQSDLWMQYSADLEALKQTEEFQRFMKRHARWEANRKRQAQRFSH